MKAILGITLCVLTVWMTIWSPHAAVGGPAKIVASESMPQCGALGSELAEIGAGEAMLPADLAAAEGGWWNWVRKILRAILDLIPGGDEDCGEEPQP